ncbi:MAG: SBBP repeat-containing protein [Candidatus Krumholzibacteria bacterium]|nr:SBBP repeat-containing protein [Candidatus Krumholzibacteria bacterium]
MITVSRSILIVSILLASYALPASAQQPQWSQRFGGAIWDEGYDLAVDLSGNVLITGAFTDTVDFGGGPLFGAGSRDIYVAKYDANGGHLWSQGFGNNNSQRGESIAADASHNVVVAGDFSGTVNFGGGSLVSIGGWDMFLAKFDASGNHIWSQRFGSTVSSNADGARAVAVDGSGNIYLAGYFSGTVDFGGGPLVSAGGYEAFIAKYDPSGTHIWSQRFGSTSFDYATAVAVDGSANVVLTGRITGTVDFGGGPISGGNMFIAKFDSSGAHVWSQAFSANANGVTVDPAGNVLVTGGFDNVDFGGGPLVGPSDIYVVKFDPSGNHVWSIGFGSPHDLEWGADLAVDGLGNVFVTGEFWDTMTVGAQLLESRGANDPFVAWFDPDGNAVWADVFGGPVEPGSLIHTNDRAAGIDVDGSGNVIVSGWFDYTADFGLGTLTSAGERDVYLAKYTDIVVSSVGESNPPRIHTLHPNVPNPFNPTTSIAFTLRETEHVTIRVYDVAGRPLRTLLDESRGPGRYEAVWNGTDDAGSLVSSGVYFCRMKTATFEQTRRMVLLK